MKCFAPEDGEGRGHDWVVVPWVNETTVSEDGKEFITPLNNAGKLLWACPCGEFKWTSYADWEGREKPDDNIMPDSSPDSHGVHTRAEPPNTATTRDDRPLEVTGAAHPLPSARY